MSQQGSQGQGDGNDGGDDDGGNEQISWVGEQRLMHGYCGRATKAVQAPMPEAEPLATPRNCESSRLSRPAVAMSGRAKQRRQAVVRVGPPARANAVEAAAAVAPSEAA